MYEKLFEKILFGKCIFEECVLYHLLKNLEREVILCSLFMGYIH